MCETNSATLICNVPVDIYLARKKSGICPRLHFCAHIHGFIIYHLLQQLRDNNPANVITNDKFIMGLLVGVCNLDFKPIACLIIPALKSSIKYIWRKVVQSKMVNKIRGEWAFDSKYHFASIEALGIWFKTTLGEPTASKNGQQKLNPKQNNNQWTVKRLQDKGPKRVFVQPGKKGNQLTERFVRACLKAASVSRHPEPDVSVPAT
ncbi:uncharacterized protein B0J16DRAFT_388835 [Fusarium flagelliforme]|uniref:uncharacterized protein n=1 Tax=Fusarium flagelliforme TaxID=2675880 RepID=UPI001E8DADEE|nr:uncharacterized protein B0J16DRAFT_388835 [Fusarium flagelliforme]KAH7175006.1 hypothetical protein B0J16DRAFT_388835 [Fusarium flagelliforme]